MEVCQNCFADKEIIGLILSSKVNGDCPFCESKNVYQLSIQELEDFFQELIYNFHPSPDGDQLISILQDEWNLFSSVENGNKILNEVLGNIFTDISDSTELVEYDDEIIENIQHWETLKNELKRSSRFISNIDYLIELGWDGFFNTQYELLATKELFRARVHHQSGLREYSPNEMLSPKPQQVGGGRANPLGIPYLYLSESPKTVLYEVRASYLDELSVATFHVKDKFKSIEIVDFTEDASLFQPSKINQTIKATLLKKHISQDLSKPMRRYDTEIEYIPTQFICEFIKIITGAKGIRFYSSLHKGGKNVVIFDEDKMKCEKVELMKINIMNLEAVYIK